ncbi:hypothetical protein JQC92_04280 [Shewanella sp. 202IG2-18]|uniref:hypothetical protein n=1 Tax=Parashewanella hymeniacidonis TaxID=2807618 RepID=UPI0019601BA7|nr:hypothetical protein [Parashewanella hymeniacidonis]MBM7071258.1 hypothetical protein [Parashewanella hymeniacidonis]
MNNHLINWNDDEFHESCRAQDIDLNNHLFTITRVSKSEQKYAITFFNHVEQAQQKTHDSKHLPLRLETQLDYRQQFETQIQQGNYTKSSKKNGKTSKAQATQKSRPLKPDLRSALSFTEIWKMIENENSLVVMDLDETLVKNPPLNIDSKAVIKTMTAFISLMTI